MYSFYLDDILLPIPPSKLEIKINNQNKKITLINDGEINIIKDAGLTELSFEAILPQQKYPFARYNRIIIGAEVGNFMPASDFLEKIEKLKTEKEPFQFIVSRALPHGEPLFDTNIKVTLEEYKISEDAKNGFDVVVTIKLKQYRAYKTKTYKVKKNKSSAFVQDLRPKSKNNPTPKKAETYKVKKGDTLPNIAKRFYGDSSFYKAIQDANKGKVKSPNKLIAGTVLTIPAISVLPVENGLREE